MKYKGIVLTLDNCWEVLEDSDTAILDEVRLAILDDTDISGYIEVCKGDDYRLKQVRMALREGFPKKYLQNNLNAENIKYLRKMYSLGIDLDIVANYLDLDNYVLGYILLGVIKGADISKINLNRISYSIMPTVMKGLIYKYPMEIFEGHYEKHLTEEYMRVLFIAMQEGVDIMPFIKDKWDEQAINYIIAVQQSGADANLLLKYITDKCPVEAVEGICQAYKQRTLDEGKLKRLCYRDEDGFYIYNEYQIVALLRVIQQNKDFDAVANPRLSDREMLVKSGLTE